MGLGNQRHCLRPYHRRPPALGTKLGFAPCVRQIETFFGLATCARVTGVPVDSEGTAIAPGASGPHNFSVFTPGVVCGSGATALHDRLMVSSQVQTLEDRPSVHLPNRTTRNVSLTEAYRLF